MVQFVFETWSKEKQIIFSFLFLAFKQAKEIFLFLVQPFKMLNKKLLILG